MKVYNVANKDETAFYSSGFDSRYMAEELLKISIQHDPDAHVVEYEVKTELEKVKEELAQVKAERDQAVADIALNSRCHACRKFFKNGGDCSGGVFCIPLEFEWLGVQKEE